MRTLPFQSSLITREIFAVRMGIYRDNVGIALPILGHLAVNAYKPWEVEEVRIVVFFFNGILIYGLKASETFHSQKASPLVVAFLHRYVFFFFF